MKYRISGPFLVVPGARVDKDQMIRCTDHPCMDTEPQGIGPVADVISQTGIGGDPFGSTLFRIEERDRDILELLFLDFGYGLKPDPICRR